MKKKEGVAYDCRKERKKERKIERKEKEKEGKKGLKEPVTHYK